MTALKSFSTGAPDLTFGSGRSLLRKTSQDGLSALRSLGNSASDLGGKSRELTRAISTSIIPFFKESGADDDNDSHGTS